MYFYVNEFEVALMIIYFLVVNSKRRKFKVGVNDSIFSGKEQQKV